MSKFYCSSCNYSCNYESKWNQHINTLKHKNNGIIIKKKKSLDKKCTECDYIAKHSEGLKNHKLTKHSSKEEREKYFRYYCKECDFGSFKKQQIDIHNKTTRHLIRIKYS